MALVAVASVKGSPGVTTTSLLLGTLWPRPCVVAECDPSGGDVAWRMPDPEGRPLDPQSGLLSLVAAGRRALYPGLILHHSQTIVGGQQVLAGVTGPEQATGVPWGDLGDLFASAPGLDVIADLGRIGARTPQSALLEAASAIVVVLDAVPSSVVHVRDRLGRMEANQSGLGRTPPFHVVVVAPPKRSRAVREVEDALQRSEARIDSVHHLAHDESGARFFLGQVRGRADRTALVRSGTPMVQELADRTVGAFVEPEAAEPLPEAGEPVPQSQPGSQPESRPGSAEHTPTHAASAPAAASAAAPPPPPARPPAPPAPPAPQPAAYPPPPGQSRPPAPSSGTSAGTSPGEARS